MHALDSKPARIPAAPLPVAPLQRAPILQHSILDKSTTRHAPSTVQDVLQSSGQPLDAETRAFMEPRFGHNFSRVRIHTDQRAAQSAAAVNALAYTVGSKIVFGEGQYRPGTNSGKGLLAHELTHVIQQGSRMPNPGTALIIGTPNDPAEAAAERAAGAAHQGMAIPALGISAPVLRRQTPRMATLEDFDRMNPPSSGSTAAQQAEAPASAPAVAEPQGWQDCDPGEIPGLNHDLAQATDWVDEAVRDLQRDELPAHTRGALSRYLTSDPEDVANHVLPQLIRMQTELHGGSSNFCCRTQEQCAEIIPSHTGASAIATHPITICGNYFNALALLGGAVNSRAGILIHETAHHAGLGGDTYTFTWPFPGLEVSERLQNADSMTAFVLTNHSPVLSPVVGPTMLSVRTGGSTLSGTGSASPRFVVTVGADVALARHIFQFFDLRLGIRFDVDTNGSIIATTSLGPRIFAPVSLTDLPVYLDLQGGFVGGNDPTQVSEANRILGISTEARLGIQSGHFGGSISYRHIFDLMRSNSDIDQVSIFGEINF
jgi:hypothetical protein